MLNIIICEDNHEQLKTFSNAVQKTLTIESLDMQLVLESNDPNKVIDYVMNSNMSGLYFLDIDLKAAMNGLELAREIRKYDPRGFIVFITTHAEMSYLTFIYKVEAMDFIIKDHFHDIELRIRECILDAHAKTNTKPSGLQKNFSLKTDGRIINVEYDKIMFFETSDRSRKVILHAVDRQVEFTAKIMDIEEQLDHRFYRCHKSFLVNKENIREMDLKNRILHMTNGEQCLVASRMVKELKL